MSSGRKPVHCYNCYQLIYWNQNRKTKGIFYTDTPYYDKNEVHRINKKINHVDSCPSSKVFNPKFQHSNNRYEKLVFDFDDYNIFNQEERLLLKELKRFIEDYDGFEIIQILNLNKNSIKTRLAYINDDFNESNIQESYKGVLTNFSIEFLFFNESDFNNLKFKGYYFVELDNKIVVPFNTFYKVKVLSELTEKNIFKVFEGFKLQVSEGEEKYGLHKYHERDINIVKEKKKEALRTFGKLQCEICEFNFEDKYGVQFIECHHLKPFSELKDVVRTSLEDLILVCSNCHRVIHKKKYEPLSPVGLKKLILKHNK